jgi:hypothetical protein
MRMGFPLSLEVTAARIAPRPQEACPYKAAIRLAGAHGSAPARGLPCAGALPSPRVSGMHQPPGAVRGSLGGMALRFCLGDVLGQVLRAVGAEHVGQVVAVTACAPSLPAKRERDTPDLPRLAPFFAERVQGFLNCRHRSPRSRSASSMALRRPSGLMALTTMGGDDLGRRAYTTPASTPGQVSQPG